MEKKIVYIVKYSSGSWDDYCEYIIFISEDLKKVKKWVRKFNSIHKKWLKYYNSFTNKEGWIDDELIETHFNRWHLMRKINRATYNEIEMR